MTREVCVGAVQLNSSADPEANVDRAIELVTRAANNGAQYVQLPEYFNYRGPTSRYTSIAESIPGPTTTRLGQVAKDLGITLHVGSLFERSEQAEKCFNTSVLIAPSGDVAETYRKVHLFDVDVPGGVEYRESRDIAAGDRVAVVNVDGFRLGMSICFDLRFPEFYRRLCEDGATVLAVPSSFNVGTGRAHWKTLLSARAIENHAFVVAAAQAGMTSEGVASYGHSMIIDPWGEVLAESTLDDEDVLVVQIDLDEVDRRRSQISVLDLRRPDVYEAARSK